MKRIMVTDKMHEIYLQYMTDWSCNSNKVPYGEAQRNAIQAAIEASEEIQNLQSMEQTNQALIGKCKWLEATVSILQQGGGMTEEEYKNLYCPPMVLNNDSNT